MCLSCLYRQITAVGRVSCLCFPSLPRAEASPHETMGVCLRFLPGLYRRMCEREGGETEMEMEMEIEMEIEMEKEIGTD